MRKILSVLAFAGISCAVELAPHDLTTNWSHLPYVVSASSFYSTLPAWKAFDNGTAYWLGTGSGTDWLKIQMAPGSRQSISSYQITVNDVPEPDRAPKNWTLECSNDNSSWSTLDTQTDQTAWTSGQTRTFTPIDTTTACQMFRVNITANNGDATYTQIAELHLIGTITIADPGDFAPHDLTSNTSHSPFVTSASTVYSTNAAWKALDSFREGTDVWMGTNGGTDWWKIDTGNSYTLAGYLVAFADLSTADRAPKNWTLQGSNNDSDWTTLQTIANETGWNNTALETRSFSTNSETGYRYFRLNITANNSDGTYTVVSEMYLYGSIVAAASIPRHRVTQ